MGSRWKFDRRCVFGCCYRFENASDKTDCVWVPVKYFWQSLAEREQARREIITAALS